MNQSYQSLGQIETTTLGENGLLIRGWACDPASPLVGLSVRCGQKTFEDFELERFLDSPRLRRFYPPFPGLDKARFCIRIPLDASAQRDLENQFVELVPHFESHHGRTLRTIVKSSLPAPSREELALVSPNLPVAFEFLDYFIDLAHLPRDGDVLDVGCGTGRMAYPLAHYLGPTGSYQGFDVVGNFIDVAQTRYRSLENFRFQKVGVHNEFYSPDESLAATELSFPYDDESFDLVFLASVFTHMRSEELCHYLDEIRRVLRSGARCLMTAFLVTPESSALMADGKARFNLRHRSGDWFTSDPSCPEKAIGFDEGALLAWIAERGLQLEDIHRGSWCGRMPFVSFQDLLLVSKAER